MIINYEEMYAKIYDWFTKRPSMLSTLKFLYKLMPFIYICSYIALILYALLYCNKIELFKIIFIPFLAFLFTTIIRKIIDMPRPYTKYNITPLIKKNKAGQSFPSRHTVSAVVIAMSWLYVDITTGIILLIFSVLLGIIRVLSGVHFIADVVSAFAISILLSIFGFWII
jgi:membrane-associated phospholipid phosphatase